MIASDWIKFETGIDGVISVYRRIGEKIEVQHSSLNPGTIQEYPKSIEIDKNLSTFSLVKEVEETMFMGTLIPKHNVYLTKLCSTVIGWETKTVVFEKTNASELVLVSINNGVVVADTHGIFNSRNNTLTCVYTGVVTFKLNCKNDNTFQCHVNYSKAFTKANDPTNMYTPKNGHVTFSKTARAGDVISLLFDGNKIESGTIQINPNYDTIVTKPTLGQIEYLGEVIKIKEAGNYSVYTEDGRIKIKRIDE